MIRELNRPQVGQATIRTKKFKGKQVDPQQSVYKKIGGLYNLL